MSTRHSLYLVAHNIRSCHNVGSLFRTADAVGVAHLFLTGYSPSPVDQYGRPRSDIHKTALGAEETVPWTHRKNIGVLIQKLKKEGYRVIALEQSSDAVEYRTYAVSGPTALIVGNEVRGISPAILKKCDAIIFIPMRGKKESLNVSVAAGIALYALTW